MELFQLKDYIFKIQTSTCRMHKCTPNLLTGQAVREVGKTLILSKQLNIRQIISCIDNIFITTPPQNSK